MSPHEFLPPTIEPNPLLDGEPNAVTADKKSFASKREWRTAAALLALTFVPIIAGLVRLAALAANPAITPENARFFAAPVPVVIHILTATPFCVLGAFQFLPSFRRRRPKWHRVTGRLLIFAGLAASLSGLWMTHYYPIHEVRLQGGLLYGFRLLIGSAMAAGILLSWAAIRRGDVARHRAWIIRAYAIGQGAGTQVVVILPWQLLIGTPSEPVRDVLMILAWLINLTVAEWIIRRPTVN